MDPAPDATRTHGAEPAPPAFDPALDAGLAAAFGSDRTPGGWSRPPLLRDDPSTRTPVVQTSSPEMPPDNGGPYQLLGEIARGGMGVILKGRDPDLGRDLAVKVLRTELADRPAAVQRFVEEAQVGGQLQHPGIVPVYDLGRFADGRPYFAMKLVKGQTFSELLAQRADPSVERGRFVRHFLQICQTMAYAHSKSVIHRDLKPSNVMVGAFDEVLVMNWGLAKVLPRGGIADEERAGGGPHPVEDGVTEVRTVRAGSGSDTAAGSVLGTPAFMPPEQAGGEVDKLDERADVFGLGAILCVILTGRPPYVAGTGEAVRLLAVRGQLGDGLARLDACGADPELIGVCKRCLSADRDARPRQAAAVASAVSAHLAGVEDRAKRAELDRAAAEARAEEEGNTRRVAEEKAGEERKRRKVQLALAAMVGLLLFTGGAFGWYTDRQAEQRKREQAEVAIERERAEGERRTVQARLEGERDAEARNTAARARRGVAAGLQLATDLRRQYKFKAAETALNHAMDLTRSGAPELLPAVEQAKQDLAFVVDLDDIRYRKWVWVEDADRSGSFNLKTTAPAYRRAFADRGLNLATGDPREVARRVAASDVKADLVAALDDWALHEPEPALRDRLLELAQCTDPNAWADRLRDAKVWRDPAALARLTAEIAPASAAPAVVHMLAELMEHSGQDPSDLLTAARVRHPADFELAFALGRWYTRRSPAEALNQVGPYEAARALRPENFAVWNNLGNALSAKGDAAGAIACLTEAIRLEPNLAIAHFNLGTALARKGDVDGAIRSVKAGMRLSPNRAAAHYHLGTILGKTGDTDGAIASIREAIRLDPRYAAAHDNLGVLLDKKGDTDGAIACHKEAIRLEPLLANAHGNLGAALLTKGDVDGAIASQKFAIRLEPTLGKAHYNLGIARERKGDVDGAIVCLKEALRLDPKFALAHTGMGTALAAKGDWDGAIARHKEAIRLDSKVAVAHCNLGNALSAKGDGDGAIACFKEAIRLDPKLAVAHGNLGNALSAKGDVDGAIACYKEAIRLDPMNALPHSNLGSLKARSGDPDGAIACFKEAIRLDPKLAVAHGNLGNALSAKGNVDGAIVSYKEAIRLDPKLVLTHCNLGHALSVKGDVDGAIICYKEAIRLDPKLAVAHGNLGNALSAKGDVDGAIACYKEAILLDSKKPQAYCNLGNMLTRKGDSVGAIACFKEAIRLNPKDALVHYNLGIVLSQKGDPEGAIACYKETIRLDPNYPQSHCNLGMVLAQQGRFADALPLLRRGHELGSKRPGWKYPSARWVADCERALADQEARTAPPPHEVKRSP